MEFVLTPEASSYIFIWSLPFAICLHKLLLIFDAWKMWTQNKLSNHLRSLHTYFLCQSDRIHMSWLIVKVEAYKIPISIKSRGWPCLPDAYFLICIAFRNHRQFSVLHVFWGWTRCLKSSPRSYISSLFQTLRRYGILVGGLSLPARPVSSHHIKMRKVLKLDLEMSQVHGLEKTRGNWVP